MKNILEDQTAKQAALDENIVLQSPPLLPKYVYIPHVPRTLLYIPEERKGATYEEVTKTQENWIITTNLKIVIIERRVLHLVQQAHKETHMGKTAHKNFYKDIWYFWGC